MNFERPRLRGTLNFMMAWLVPWRPAFRARARHSGLAFSVHCRDLIGRHIAKYGVHEPLVTRWMANYLGAVQQGFVIDIGANIGWHTLHAAAHPNIETVLAFEPDPFNAWLLDRNLSQNGVENVIVDTRPVGAAPGIGHLYRYKSSNFGRHSLATDHGYGSRTVPVTDLDGALDALGFGERHVALIKIDVEGFEPAVIEGAMRTLARTDAVILEYSPNISNAAGFSTNEMIGRLQTSGFVPFVLGEDGSTVRTNVDELRGMTVAIDVIWLRADRVSAAIMRAMNERERGSMTLDEISMRNRHVRRLP